MNFRRAINLVLLLSAAVGSSAFAQWPTKPITLIVPFPPGGGTDTFARPLAAQLSKQLGKPIVVDNRGGAGGTIGASIAAKAAGDGYTFFLGAVHHAIAPSFYKKLDYDIQKDLVPITVVANPPQVVVINPNRLKVNSLQELIDVARKSPDKYNYGSAGNGTSHHLAGELFKQVAKISLVHVSYRGAGPALSDLVAGNIDMMFDGLGSSAQHVRGGRIKALAVAAPQRAAAFPDVPTAAEAGVAGYEVSTWYGLWGVKGTPKEILDRMHAEVVKAMQDPQIRETWTANGSDTKTMSPTDFAALVNKEIKRWAEVTRISGAKLD